MPQLFANEIDDLVYGTLKELGRMKFQQVAQELQRYEVFTKWFRKDKVIFDDSYAIQRNVMARYDHVAKHTGLADVDNVNIADLMEVMGIGWRHSQTHWGYYHREVLMNRGKSLVFNILKPRRASATISMARLLEEAAWGSVPDVSDKKTPYGVKYWITKSATQGFNGMAPGAHTTKGGINPNDVEGWRNYTDTYQAVSKADLIKKMRKMHRKVDFASPVDIEDYRKGSGQRFRYYVNEETMSDVEDVGEAQNDNLGRDIGSVDGINLTFKRSPLIWVPYLDDDTTDPIYALDHSTFYPVVLKGDYLRESSPIVVPNQHDARALFTDMTYNFLCLDIRRNGVISK